MSKKFSKTHQIPMPLSPYVLLQETLWPNEWLILVSCVLLNQTSRKQVEKIFHELVKRWPDAETMANAEITELASVIKPLGLYERRSKTLIKLSKAYLNESWVHARDLPGCGEYAQDAWSLFCQHAPKRTPYSDSALEVYRKWLLKNKREFFVKNHDIIQSNITVIDVNLQKNDYLLVIKKSIDILTCYNFRSAERIAILYDEINLEFIM